METVEKQGNGMSGTAIGLGAGALGLWALQSGFLGNLAGGNRMPPPPSDPIATRYDLEQERKMTELNSENGQLKAQIYTDQQVLAAERRLADRITTLADKVNAQNQTQAVLNAHQSDAIAMVQGEINRYKMMFSLYINQPTMAASEAALTAFKAPAAAGAGANGTGA